MPSSSPQPLTPRWTALKPHPVQQALWRSPHRFNTVPAGRRSGKTEIAGKRKLIKRALEGSAFLDPRYFAAAPTRDQAKRIYWRDLKRMIPPSLIADISETELRIDLVHGSEIYVVGMDKPERIEGVAWDGGVLDEYANMKPETWPEHVRPALSDRGGWCDFIGVPEGRNHYYDLHRQAVAEQTELGVGSQWGAFHWKSADILPKAEIKAARKDLDELTYKQEYEGSFVNFEGRAYYAFGERTHTAHLRDRYNRRAPLVFCFDFNVAPGCAAVAQEMALPHGKEGTGWIGEVWIPRNSHTPAICRRLAKDWAGHQGPVVCYGDASGGASGSAKVRGSDWDIIRDELRRVFGRRLDVRVPSSNPPERARVNAVNSRLRAGDGTRRMIVDPKACSHLVTDLEGVQTLKGGSGEIDKAASAELTHISDAVGYYVAYEFPVQPRGQRRVKIQYG